MFSSCLEGRILEIFFFGWLVGSFLGQGGVNGWTGGKAGVYSGQR